MLGIGNSLISGSAAGLFMNYSLSFDGSNDMLTLADSLNLGTADFSWSFWINSPIDNSGYAYIISKKQDNNNNNFIAINSSKKITIQFRGGGNTPTFTSGASSLAPLANTWIHVCVSADRDGNIGVYINGTTDTYGLALTSMSNSSQTLTNTADWAFSSIDSSGWGSGIEMFMTDVAFFNAALSAAEVTAIYNNGVPGDLLGHSQSSALTAYWRFNENTGTTVADEIGSNDLTIDGATWSTNVP